MSWFTRILITSVISFGIAVFLSFLPRLDLSGFELQGNWFGFKTIRPVQIDEQGLVDHLSQLPLKLDMTRVEWSHSILSIDLVLPYSGTAQTYIMQDLYLIAKLGIADTTNVKQVLIRVLDYAQHNDKGQLLLAMDAGRDQISKEDEAVFRQNKEASESYLRSKFRLTYTPKWKEKYETQPY